MIVTKFGGSSLADAAQFKKVKSILEMDHDRKFVVPSAPGKRGPGDDKITDLLYACHAAAESGKPFRHFLERIRARYEEIAQELTANAMLDTEMRAQRLIDLANEHGGRDNISVALIQVGAKPGDELLQALAQ